MLNDFEFLKKENEIIQEFFNSNDEETHLKRIKEVLTNYVQKNLQNGSSRGICTRLSPDLVYRFLCNLR